MAAIARVKDTIMHRNLVRRDPVCEGGGLSLFDIVPCSTYRAKVEFDVDRVCSVPKRMGALRLHQRQLWLTVGSATQSAAHITIKQLCGIFAIEEIPITENGISQGFFGAFVDAVNGKRPTGCTIPNREECTFAKTLGEVVDKSG